MDKEKSYDFGVKVKDNLKTPKNPIKDFWQSSEQSFILDKKNLTYQSRKLVEG